MMSLYRKLMRAIAGTFASGGGDPEWDQVVLSLHGDTGPPFIDAKGKTVTAVGNTSLSTVTKQFGAGSIYFDGTGDYLTLNGSNDFVFAAGDFTIEFWLYLSTVSGSQHLVDFRTVDGTYPTLYINGTSLRYYAITADRITGTSVLAIDTWYHVALCRTNGVTRLFLDGTREGNSYTDVNNYLCGAARPIIGGRGTDSIGTLNGYIDDLRITKGVARYPADFSNTLDPYWGDTVLALTMDGVDNGTAFPDLKRRTITRFGNTVTKTATKKFGTASAYFDGVGDYLTADGAGVAGGDFVFATGDFTIEFWINFVSPATTAIFLDFRTTDGAFPTLFIQGNKLTYYVSSAARIVGTTTIVANTWYHMAVCRSSGVTKMFLDGTQEGNSYTDPTSYSCGVNRPAIGTAGNSTNTFNFTGYIDDVRITKGVARYPANFTPPTESLLLVDFPSEGFLKANPDFGQPVDPYWDNVVLGMHMDGVDTSTVFHDEKGKTVTRVGNTVTKTAVKKFGNSSAYFDGTGDYLSLADSADWEFGASTDFTIECWVRKVGNSSGGLVSNIVAKRNVTPAFELTISETVVGELGFNIWDAASVGYSPIASGPLTWDPNIFYHVAVCRQGSNYYAFRDGVLIGSSVSAVAIRDTSEGFYIGGFPGGGLSRSILGYIDDLRITKGVARYTSDFAVPTRAFPRD